MFRKSRSIAVLLDVAPFAFNGKRSVDIVKKQLIQFVRRFDEEDLFYLYNPGDSSPLDNLGDRVGVIGNYDTDGYKIQDLTSAMKQTYYILAAQDEDSHRTICYITNRFSDKEVSSLKKMLNLDRSLGHFDEPCNILILGIGIQPNNKETLIGLCKDKADVVFISDPNDLNQELQSYFDELEE